MVTSSKRLKSSDLGLAKSEVLPTFEKTLWAFVPNGSQKVAKYVGRISDLGSKVGRVGQCPHFNICPIFHTKPCHLMQFDTVWRQNAHTLYPTLPTFEKISLKLLEGKKDREEKVFTKFKIGLGRCPRIVYTGYNDRDRISVSSGVTLFCDGGYTSWLKRKLSSNELSSMK